MSDPHREHGDTSDAESDHDLARRMHERTHRPASIDMALNLERELDDEHEHEHGIEQNHNKFNNISSTSIEASPRQSQDHVSGADGSRRVSFDPQVLQHIITNLRTELTRAQSERDALQETLAGAPTREAELREALALLTERCAGNESEMERLKRKSQEDEESIQMLRTKLEESRRALMRLQTESKRMSHMSVDISRANTLFGGGPSSSKRASFTPLTGSGAGTSIGGGTNPRMNYSHRRISSVSEPSMNFDEPASPTAPSAGHAISWPQENDANVKKARRSSAFFGGMPMSMGMGLTRSATPSPPQQPRQLAADTLSLNSDMTAQELEALKKERDHARAELAAARQELAEAQEAREASEQCVVALRTFISAQTDSLSSGANANGILKLPPLPTEKNVDESTMSGNTPNKKARPVMGAGWSFGKLFRTESGGSATTDSHSTGVSPPAEGRTSLSQPDPPASTPTKATPGSGSGDASHSPSPSTATPGGAFSRTFGGFFSGRAPSITSIGSVASPPPAHAHPTSNSTTTTTTTTTTTNSNPTLNIAKTAMKPSLPPRPRPPIAHGQQEPTLNGLGSDDEDDVDLDRSLGSSTSVTSAPEPASPADASRASQNSLREEIWVRSASSAGSEVGVNDRVSLSSTSAAALPKGAENVEREEGTVQGQVGAAAS